MDIEERKILKAAITAVGGYTPKTILSNKKLEKMVDTTDEWIKTRTGIKERRILDDPHKATSYLAIKAANDLIFKNNIDASTIDLVILATVTPDIHVAATAAYVASSIGAVNAFAYDLNAACSGFLYGMSVAAAYIKSRRYKKILLIGADKMSSIVDYSDLNFDKALEHIIDKVHICNLFIGSHNEESIIKATKLLEVIMFLQISLVSSSM